jgi:hypothetical protein
MRPTAHYFGKQDVGVMHGSRKFLRASSSKSPKLLARHFGEAGLVEKAATYWSKAGQRSLGRSALAEAVEQLKRALDALHTLPATPAQRREQIRVQVTLVNPLMQVKGYAAPETKAAIERARLLIDQQAEALGETPEDPLLLFSVLYGFWAANYVGFNGDALRELASQFLSLAEKQDAIGALIVGHRLTGTSLVCTGDMAGGRPHLDRAITLYRPEEHRPLALRFGQDVRVPTLSSRALALWMLGYPGAALTDMDQMLTDAREIGQAATVMYALVHAAHVQLLQGNCDAVNSLGKEVVILAEDKGASLWKGGGLAAQGFVSVMTGQAPEAIQRITTGINRAQRGQQGGCRCSGYI